MLFPSLSLLLLSMNEGNDERCTPAQLRRAAGSQSIEKLKEAVIGWSVEEMNNMSRQKTPLHMAAWQGTIENVEFLLDMGCDINQIATNVYTYGKTPIFFAVTRKRNEVTEYLISRGANVKIVNNKGQSVLSLASTHLDAEVIQKIQLAEERQSETEWLNFRESHSDGLEYGDLDPRFYNRTSADKEKQVLSATALAINPTTPQSRKGAFDRRNPQAARTRKKQTKGRKVPKAKAVLAEKDRVDMDEAWTLIRPMNDSDQSAEKFWLVVSHLETLRIAWIPDVCRRLLTIEEDAEKWVTWFRDMEITKVDGRRSRLREKLVNYLRSPSDYSRNCQADRTSEQPKSSSPAIHGKVWQTALSYVVNVSFQSIPVDSSLDIFRPPEATWIETVDQLSDLEQTLQEHAVIAVDTEWFETKEDETKIRLSTLQLAIVIRPEGSLRTWVVDLKTRPEGDKYNEVIKQFVLEMLSSKLIIGFSVEHDLSMLDRWLDIALSRSNVVDVQSLWYGQRNLPGLAACVMACTGTTLSKTQQRSKWEKRPLTEAQIEYAALDACILLPLLAEQARGNPSLTDTIADRIG